MDPRSVGGPQPVARPSSFRPPVPSAAAPGDPSVVPRPEAAVRVDLSDGVERRAALDQLLREVIQRHLIIEPRTREVVQQTVNSTTGEVLRQFPEEAILRLRAHAREMTEPARPAGAGEPARSGNAAPAWPR